MSKAKPMAHEARALNYTEILNGDGTTAGYRQLTPRQGRRFRHKVHRGGYDGVPYSIGKGRPTPRQRKPRRDG